ncbi:MAG: YmdB family metallophosphoesterase [Spirochaetales bacterium]|nr:YmdB family metallophosphoesterase [Spirochaetales bacterium]
MGVRILCIGEIVGSTGIYTVKALLARVKKEQNIDFVLANGEGATGGFGIGKNHAVYLRKLGIDVITSGEKIYYKKDMVEHIQKAPYILRPANYPPGNPGRGWRVYEVAEKKIAVISLLGQSGFRRTHLSNPYTFLPEIVSRLKEETPIIILDFHSATTAEKYTMFHLADGLVSAVIGTHSKALTADAHILPGGTAVICDNGRTGSLMSVGGLDPEIEIRKFLQQIPERSKNWTALPELQGAVVEIGEDGKATHIEALRIQAPEIPDDGNSENNND